MNRQPKPLMAQRQKNMSKEVKQFAKPGQVRS